MDGLGTVQGNLYLSLSNGFVDLWETIARLSEVRELTLQILYHARNGPSSDPRLVAVLYKTYISLLFDVSPYKFILERVDLFL